MSEQGSMFPHRSVEVTDREVGETKKALRWDPPTSPYELRIRQVDVLLQMALASMALDLRKRDRAQLVCKLDKVLLADDSPLHKYRSDKKKLDEQVREFRRNKQEQPVKFVQTYLELWNVKLIPLPPEEQKPSGRGRKPPPSPPRLVQGGPSVRKLSAEDLKVEQSIVPRQSSTKTHLKVDTRSPLSIVRDHGSAANQQATVDGKSASESSPASARSDGTLNVSHVETLIQYNAYRKAGGSRIEVTDGTSGSLPGHRRAQSETSLSPHTRVQGGPIASSCQKQLERSEGITFPVCTRCFRRHPPVDPVAFGGWTGAWIVNEIWKITRQRRREANIVVVEPQVGEIAVAVAAEVPRWQRYRESIWFRTLLFIVMGLVIVLLWRLGGGRVQVVKEKD